MHIHINQSKSNQLYSRDWHRHFNLFEISPV